MLCKHCYKIALSIANLPCPKLFMLFYPGFKERFQFTTSHEECENCRMQRELLGDCHCKRMEEVEVVIEE